MTAWPWHRVRVWDFGFSVVRRIGAGRVAKMIEALWLWMVHGDFLLTPLAFSLRSSPSPEFGVTWGSGFTVVRVLI